jgi:hypothetical protein
MKTTTIETYGQQKARHHDELNGFEGIFFAFSNEQFAEGMAKVGLSPEDTKQIYSLGAGGYLLKTRSKAWGEILKRHEMERKQLRANKKALVDALVYELRNHEFCILRDPQEAVEAIGETMETIDKGILKAAIQQYNKQRAA